MSLCMYVNKVKLNISTGLYPLITMEANAIQKELGSFIDLVLKRSETCDSAGHYSVDEIAKILPVCST